MSTLATLIVKLKADTGEFNEELEDSAGRVGKLASKLKSGIATAGKVAIGGMAAIGAGALAGGVALGKLAADAAELEGLEAAFRGLAESSGQSADDLLAALQQGSSGMIAQRDLMTSYNKAAQLISTDVANQLPNAFQYLGKVSAATGQDMDFLLDSLVTGVGRLSPMILDNLSIQTSLSEATERAAEMFGVEASELTKTQQQAGMMAVVLEKLEKNTAAMPDVTGTATQKMAKLKATLQDTKDRIGRAVLPVFTKLLDAIAAGAEKYLPVLLEAFETQFVPFLENTLIPAISNLVQWFAANLPAAIQTVVDFWNSTLKPVLMTLYQWFAAIIPPAIQLVADFFTGTLLPAIQGAITWIQQNGPGIVDALVGAFNQIVAVVGPIISTVVSILQEQFGAIVAWAQENWPLISEAISDTLGTIQSIVSTVLQGLYDFWVAHGTQVMDFLRNLWTVITTIISTGIDAVVGVIRAVLMIISGDWEGAWETIKGVVSTIWDGIVSVIETAIEGIKSIVSIGIEELPKIITNIGSALFNAGKAIIEKLKEGLANKLEEVKNWFADRLQDLRDMLPFSEPKAASPLRGLAKSGEAFWANWISGAQRAMPRVEATMARMMENVGQAVAPGMAGAGAGANVFYNGGNFYVDVHSAGGMDALLQERRAAERRRISKGMG